MLIAELHKNQELEFHMWVVHYYYYNIYYYNLPAFPKSQQ